MSPSGTGGNCGGPEVGQEGGLVISRERRRQKRKAKWELRCRDYYNCLSIENLPLDLELVGRLRCLAPVSLVVVIQFPGCQAAEFYLAGQLFTGRPIATRERGGDRVTARLWLLTPLSTSSNPTSPTKFERLQTAHNGFSRRICMYAVPSSQAPSKRSHRNSASDKQCYYLYTVILICA